MWMAVFFEEPGGEFLCFEFFFNIHTHTHAERCDNITFWHVYPSSKHALARPVTAPQRWMLRATMNIVQNIINIYIYISAICDNPTKVDAKVAGGRERASKISRLPPKILVPAPSTPWRSPERWRCPAPSCAARLTTRHRIAHAVAGAGHES